MSRTRTHTVVDIGEQRRPGHASRVVTYHAAPYSQRVGGKIYRPLFGTRAESRQIVALRGRRTNGDGNVCERSVVRADRAAVNAPLHLSYRVGAVICKHYAACRAVVLSHNAAVKSVVCARYVNGAVLLHRQISDDSRRGVHADYTAVHDIRRILSDDLSRALRGRVDVCYSLHCAVVCAC